MKKEYGTPEVQEFEIRTEALCASLDGSAPEYDVISGYSLDD